jgi:hypothetical protein
LLLSKRLGLQGDLGREVNLALLDLRVDLRGVVVDLRADPQEHVQE